jgi:hypothetical protein
VKQPAEVWNGDRQKDERREGEKIKQRKIKGRKRFLIVFLKILIHQIGYI